MTDPIEEQLKAALLLKLTEHGGTALEQLTSTVDTTVLLGPTSPVTLVIDTMTTDDPPSPPPPPAVPPPSSGGPRYTNIAAVRWSTKGTPIVWSAKDSQQDNVTVYATSVKYKPQQSDTWTVTPPAEQRIIGVRKVQRSEHPWGIDGFRWWYGIDTQDDTGQPEVYVADSDAQPDDTANWITAALFEERLAELTLRKRERVELLAAVDGGLADALREARADAIKQMKTYMAFPKHGDDRWYLPSRATVGGWLRTEVERLLQTD
jgi:hypothetical protein